MEIIKTYAKVDKENSSFSYRVSRMEDIYTKRNGKTDEPHRHDFYTVLIIKHASGKHRIDFNEYLLNPNQVFFVSPGQVHQVDEYEKSFGYAILFSSQFLIENNIPNCFLEDLNLFNDYGESPPLETNSAEFEKLTKLCEELIILDKSKTKFKKHAVGSFVQLLLIYCNNLCSIEKDNTQNIEAKNAILKKFKNLVDQQFTQWHATSLYASKLSVTPDHLNRVVKSLLGKTAKEYIQSRIIVEAKRMLYFSELSTKEIGYKLGFEEPANFSSFFKNCTGKSPSVFRKS